MSDRVRYDVAKDNVELVYLMVIQGRSGALKSKLLVRWDLSAEGAEMLYESSNGYSVVFSGAILKSMWMKRREWERGCRFKKAGSLKELQEMEANESEKIIGVLC